MIFKKIEELKNPDFYNWDTFDINADFEDYIQGFDSIKPDSNKTFYIKISDLFSYVYKSERVFTKGVLSELLESLEYSDDDKEVLENYGIKLFSDFKSDKRWSHLFEQLKAYL